MSETGLTAMLLMIGIVVLVICFWKQIAIFLLISTGTVFCFGVYYVVSASWPYIYLDRSQTAILQSLPGTGHRSPRQLGAMPKATIAAIHGMSAQCGPALPTLSCEPPAAA